MVFAKVNEQLTYAKIQPILKIISICVPSKTGNADFL